MCEIGVSFACDSVFMSKPAHPNEPYFLDNLTATLSVRRQDVNCFVGVLWSFVSERAIGLLG